MPGGTYWLNLPFGPCTSIAPGAIFTLTPFGSAIGFLPIRDIIFLPACGRASTHSPHVTEHFATDAGFPRGASGHHAPRGREDVRAQPAEHRRHVVDAEVHAAPRAADALDAGDHLLAVRSIFQEHADERARRAALLGRFFDQAITLDVALVLQDPRNLGLPLAR